ncbi:MAG: GNAT family N-acetyltransferase [Sphingomonas sp.]|nr:GNAT family N-acetyltransferase [Sphingomonas sp.]
MIETDRLILRNWRDADRAPYLDFCRSPAVMACLGGPLTEAEVDAAIGRVRASQDRNGFCLWAVERRADGAFLGYCGLKVADTPGTPIEDEIEIGWRLGEFYWGRGYAREAAQASLRWAWANLSTPRVIAITVPTNRRSWGLMERIGMTRRPELDFGHPTFPENHPLHQHISYAVDRPVAG